MKHQPHSPRVLVRAIAMQTRNTELWISAVAVLALIATLAL